MDTSMKGAEATSPGRSTRRPPATVLLVGALFLALGCLDLYRGVAPLIQASEPAHLAADDVLVGAIGLAALAGGAFLLSGRNWARWLLAGWMALHVALSLGKPAELLGHAIIFVVLVFFLYRPRTATYFRGRITG